MRMWMINPKFLCRKHLLGEHGEIHKHRHNFVKKHSIKGRIYPVVLIEPKKMEERHNDLSREMIRRGYKHESHYEMPDINYLTLKEYFSRVNVDLSISELKSRCPECRKRMEEAGV